MRCLRNDVASLHPVAVRAAALGCLLLVAVFPRAGTAAQEFFCTFATSPIECGFVEESKVPGRAAVVGGGREGSTAVRLRTEPGDSDVFFSGDMERNDLALPQALTDGFQGREHWWAHSILFPDDFAMPTWHMYVVFDFHNTVSGPFQANFHINFAPQADPALPGNLVLRGFGGDHDMANPYTALAVAAPVARNVWYDFVHHVRWSAGPDGFFDTWVRKGDEPMYRRVLARKGPTLYVNQGVFLKLANYHTPVCDPYPACKDRVPSQSPASSVIHDRVVRGTNWQDVVMSNGSLEGQHEESAAAYGSSTVPTSWTQYGAEVGTFSGGTILASNEPGAAATFGFTGTSVTWMGPKCNVCGIAAVSVDGGAPIMIDTAGPASPGALASEPLFSVAGLAPGVNHTLVITGTGTHSSASGNAYIAVDGFWVTPISPN